MPTNCTVVFAASAHSLSVFTTSLCCSTDSAGTPSLKIPAFSRAISGRVSPRSAVWSRPIEVIPVTSGWHTLVQSSRPPRPVSSTATSTAFSAKCRKATAVITSKKVSPKPSSRSAAATLRICSAASA